MELKQKQFCELQMLCCIKNLAATFYTMNKLLLLLIESHTESNCEKKYFSAEVLSSLPEDPSVGSILNTELMHKVKV